MCLSCAGRVLQIDGDRHEAVVDVDGSHRRVSLAVLSLDGRGVEVGEWVLIHTGFAMEVLDEASAADLIALHREVSGARDEVAAGREADRTA